VPGGLSHLVDGPPPGSVPEVVERMRAIQAGLPTTHGVAHFNRLYLAVTEGVAHDLRADAFAAPAFLERLDVRFAGLYFDALAVDEPPPAWRPLFDQAERGGILPLQYAFAGMNAHINRDLPVALVDTWGELGLEPRAGGPEHGDYLGVNARLAAVEDAVKRSYLTGLLGFLDRVFGRIDDVAAMWNVSRARDAAWVNGTALWRLRADAALSREFLATLDRSVGFAGRGLVTPAGALPLPRSLRARRFVRLVASLGA
jgi:hypothetical protein